MRRRSHLRLAQVVAFTVLALSGVALVAARRSAAPASADVGEGVVSALAVVALVVVLAATARAPRLGIRGRRR